MKKPKRSLSAGVALVVGLMVALSALNLRHSSNNSVPTRIDDGFVPSIRRTDAVRFNDVAPISERRGAGLNSNPVLESTIPPPGAVSSNAVAEVEVAAALEPDSSAADRDVALRQKMLAWTEADPLSALAWAMELSDETERNTALATLCNKLAERHPADAVALAETLQLDKSANTVLPALVQQWAAADLSGALIWIDAHATGAQRDEMLARAAYVWSQNEPAAAAQMVVEQMSGGEAQIEAAISVLHQWALRDFAGAAAWVELFPESPTRTRALEELGGIQSYQSMRTQ